MSESPEHIEFLDLIVKDLSGELDPQDQIRLKEWLASSSNNQQVYDEYKKVWAEMDQVQGKTSQDVGEEWARLEQVIDDEAVAVDSEKSNSFLRIAASIIILISVGIAIFYALNRQPYEQVVSQKQVEHIDLPEGTRVSLNVDSKLSYAKKFESESREVELEGEAFFEVKRDTLRPFIIRAGDIYVEVLGTSFNVKAYEEDAQVEVIVESGKVAVYRSGDKAHRVILVRGEKAIFQKEIGDLQAMENEDINYLSWKTRKIIFEDTPMSEVVRIVNEMYQSNLHLADPKLAECPVTTQFDNQSLETVLNVLSSTLDLTISKEGAQVIISGEGC